MLLYLPTSEKIESAAANSTDKTTDNTLHTHIKGVEPSNKGIRGKKDFPGKTDAKGALPVKIHSFALGQQVAKANREAPLLNALII